MKEERASVDKAPMDIDRIIKDKAYRDGFVERIREVGDAETNDWLDEMLNLINLRIAEGWIQDAATDDEQARTAEEFLAASAHALRKSPTWARDVITGIRAGDAETITTATGILARAMLASWDIPPYAPKTMS